MKTKLLFILICNLIICNILIAQSINLTLGSSGVFTLKDASANYLTLSQSTGQVNILKTLRMEYTANSTTGVLFKGTERFIHNYGTGNIFMGINSGNFTMSGGYNVAFGNNSLISNTLGNENTAVGESSLNKNTTGGENSALGLYSLKENTTGSGNTAIGCVSLNFNTTGFSNTALGFASMYSNSTGSINTAVGNYSLYSNSTGFNNTAIGYQSMNFNTGGFYNTAVGHRSLYNNTIGTNNSSLGMNSLYNNTTGYNNTALGYLTLYSNTTGYQNTAMGSGSLQSNTTGIQNTAVGTNSLLNNTTGYENTALGNYSLFSNTVNAGNTAVGYYSLYSNTGYQNTAVGHHSLNLNTTGNYNTAIGYNSGSTVTTGLNLTLIGIDANPSSGTVNDQVTLGNGFVTSLRCNVQTITSLSDMRDKKNIKELSLGLDFITKLKPRQFNWDKREWYDGNVSDGSKMKEAPTAGFIAQELDEAQTSENADWLNLVLKDNPEKWEATYGNLLPVVVKAIQDLKAEKDNEIAKLTAENNELSAGLLAEKSNNERLEERLTKYEEMQNMLAVEIQKLKSKDNDLKEVKLTEK